MGETSKTSTCLIQGIYVIRLVVGDLAFTHLVIQVQCTPLNSNPDNSNFCFSNFSQILPRLAML